MSDTFALGLLIPSLILAVLGFVMPRLLARILPEGIKPLLLNGFLATCAMFILSGLMFIVLYLINGMGFAQLMGAGLASNLAFFGHLALLSVMLWGPVLILSLAGLPRKWVKETW